MPMATASDHDNGRHNKIRCTRLLYISNGVFNRIVCVCVRVTATAVDVAASNSNRIYIYRVQYYVLQLHSYEINNKK